MVLPSPVSVQLDEDDRTMLQPDVVVCCDREKILQSHVYGAPDMVIEILSSSTRKKDMGLKLKNISLQESENTGWLTRIRKKL